MESRWECVFKAKRHWQPPSIENSPTALNLRSVSFAVTPLTQQSKISSSVGLSIRKSDLATATYLAIQRCET
ncbi:hypothetical protein Pla100_23690 [Neorhodopirellula pilleata]|uniref:Uncharacterized protein n=1 Tax=Neorhodopirellula pilleata TaxID=2714738 RepID=A0A5C6ACA0_9BACT|nr:hypothetical protein Pla100_23690 [Neorhodopirellula pilleata]